MDTKSKLFAIAVAVTSLAMTPSLFNFNTASAATWCEQQEKGSDLIEYCKRGWSDHDHCKKYESLAIQSKKKRHTRKVGTTVPANN